MKVTTYKGIQADFYIQAKGNNAGKPLRKPIPNSFAVHESDSQAFEAVYALWIAKVFEPYITGSVVPFIRLSDVKRILNNHLDECIAKKSEALAKIKAVDKAIANMEKRLELAKEMRKSYARSIFK
jgi:hypothetical protein